MAPQKRKLKLTNAIIQRLDPGYTWDTEVNAFGCRVFGKTGKRTFIYRYRGIGRKQREYRIGIFPAMGVDQARNEAKVLVAQVLKGQDPQRERKLRMAEATTFNDVIDAYLVWATTHHKESSLKEVQTYCRRLIRPRFGTFAVADLSFGVVQRAYDTMLEGMAVSYANKMIDWARVMWNWGKRREHVEGENPFNIDKRSVRRRRKRILNPEEFARVWDSLEKYRYQGSIRNIALLAIEMFLLTPLRKTEVFRLKWQNVNEKEGVIRVVEHKTDHIDDDIQLIITPPLRDLLDRIPQTSSPWLFPSPQSETGHIEQIDDAWRTIRKEAGIQDCTLHDMRRSWNSVGASLGYSPTIMAKVLGNSPRTNLEHYWHLQEDMRRKISEEVAAKILGYRDHDEREKKS
jgi:integrase